MIAFAVAWLISPPTEIHLRIKFRGALEGYATMSQEMQPDGGKIVRTKTSIGLSSSVRTETESQYDAQGVPVHKTITTSGSPDQSGITEITFNEDGALVKTASGERPVTLVKLAHRENPSLFWFMRDKPSIGATVMYYDFNNTDWVLSTVQYIGDKTITLNNKLVEAHATITHIGEKSALAMLDDQGLPLTLDYEGVRLERLPE